MPAQLGNGSNDNIGPLLDVEQLTVRFVGLTAVNQVSLSIRSGETLGLIGPNGAGKTSFINALTGETEISTGHITLNGVDLTRRRPHERARLGLGRTFQNLELTVSVSALENVLTAREMFARWRPEVRRTRRCRHDAMELLEVVGISDRADMSAGALPAGIQKRLELARALALEPTLLLLDEPAAGLDSFEKESFIATVRSAMERGGITGLVVEHDMSVISELCNRVVVMNVGSVIAEGTYAQVAKDDAVLDAYLGRARSNGSSSINEFQSHLGSIDKETRR